MHAFYRTIAILLLPPASSAVAASVAVMMAPPDMKNMPAASAMPACKNITYDLTITYTITTNMVKNMLNPNACRGAGVNGSIMSTCAPGTRAVLPDNNNYRAGVNTPLDLDLGNLLTSHHNTKIVVQLASGIKFLLAQSPGNQSEPVQQGNNDTVFDCYSPPTPTTPQAISFRVKPVAGGSPASVNIGVIVPVSVNPNDSSQDMVMPIVLDPKIQY